MDYLSQLIVAIAILVATGILIVGGVHLFMQARQRHADVMRGTYEVVFHGPVSHAQELAFIRSLTGMVKSKPWKPRYALSFERVANGDDASIRYYLHTPGKITTGIDELIGEHINASLAPISDDEDVVANTGWDAGMELTIGAGPIKTLIAFLRGEVLSTAMMQSLRILDLEGTSRGFNAKFKGLPPGSMNVMQVHIVPDRPRHPSEGDKEKMADHTFSVQIRLGATGENAEGLVKDLSGAFKAMDAPGARFRKRVMSDVPLRIQRRDGASGFPMLLSAKELSAFLWELNSTGSKRAKRLPPSPIHDTDGLVVGASDILKLAKRQVAIPEKALTVHSWVLGPSGTGKSNLLLNLAVQAMDKNLGLVLIEPKGDLARDVLNAIPLHRIPDLIWLDPLDMEHPIGLNVLSGDDPERVTSHVIGMFKNLSGDTWSAQLQRVLRNAVMTAAINGLTLYDVKQLLVNKEYRSAQVRKLNRNIHPDIIQEWRWLDDKADMTVDSAVNRLDAFLGSRMIRNIVSQKDGLDFDEIVRKRKVLLVPLSEAHMGQTNASALGQLIFDMVWDATLRRPPEKREPNLMMVDEFQMFCEMMNTTKADPFALARSYGLGLMVANQYADQLPKAVQQTLSKNAQSQIVFRLASEDAGKLASTFAPLTHDDLANLPRYTVAAKLMSSQGNAPVVTLKTAKAYSRLKYGRPVADVEADLLTRHKTDEPRKRPRISGMGAGA